MALKRMWAFIITTTTARIPASQIMHSTRTAEDDVCLLTESAKSLSGVIGSDRVVPVAVCERPLWFGNTIFTSFSNQEKICGKLSRFTGRNGTVKIPAHMYHKLNCMRLVKWLVNSRFVMTKIPVMAQRKKLHSRKWMTKSVMRIPPFAFAFLQRRAQGIYFCGGELVVFDIGRNHGSDISMIKTLEKRMALLTDIFRFCYQRSVDKNPALLFVRKRALCRKTFD